MILIIYQSYFGNTAKVAQWVAEGLRKEGFEVTAVLPSGVNEELFRQADAFILGSPTRAFRPSAEMQSFTRAFKGVLKDRKVAFFDTRIKTAKSGFLSWMLNHLGYADDWFTKKLRASRSVLPGKAFYVSASEGPLVPGSELDAYSWAKLIAPQFR